MGVIWTFSVVSLGEKGRLFGGNEVEWIIDALLEKNANISYLILHIKHWTFHSHRMIRIRRIF